MIMIVHKQGIQPTAEADFVCDRFLSNSLTPVAVPFELALLWKRLGCLGPWQSWNQSDIIPILHKWGRSLTRTLLKSTVLPAPIKGFNAEYSKVATLCLEAVNLFSSSLQKEPVTH
jgi:hypothetical protein